MLQDEIRTRMQAAMKARDKDVVSTLRLVLTAVRNAEVEKMGKLDDAEVVAVIGREAKRRKEAIEAYSAAGREDLADNERREKEILDGYLPAQLAEEELVRMVEAAIAEAGAAGPGDLGKIMGPLMAKLKGQADGGLVNRLVRERLAGS
ncbi:MAG: GatB/YqeY domain-containing protein [Actinomycetota bacterium]